MLATIIVAIVLVGLIATLEILDQSRLLSAYKADRLDRWQYGHAVTISKVAFTSALAVVILGGATIAVGQVGA